jgi:uncharacterized protein
MKKIPLFVFLILVSLQFVRAEFIVPPLPSSPVYDEVGLLKPEEKTSIEQQILTLEKETNHQIGIAIIKSLQGRTIEEVGIVLARSWWIGQKWLDNGLLILITPTEREMRIEVGRGLEWVITDLMSQRIIDENFKPNFQAENYGAGLAEWIERMSPLLRGEVVELPNKKSSFKFTEETLIFIVVLFWGLLSVLSASRSWWLGWVAGGIIWLIFLGTIGAITIGVFGLILDYFLSKFTYKKIPFLRAMGNNRWWWGGGFGGWSSGGGWGGFWGGGFGGWGASGRW